MTIKQFFNNLFFKAEPQRQDEVKPIDKTVNENLFTCHYCNHQFEVTSKMIFPTSVRLLYKDQYVTGKGVKCPKCLNDCIFG